MRLGAPYPLDEVHHKRGGEVDQTHRKRAGDHPAAGRRPPRDAMPRRPNCGSVSSSQRDHLEILVAEKISVPATENKKIYFPH
ncbi:MAG: hypothetical protein WA459_03135 [Stellaceae bacterium]